MVKLLVVQILLIISVLSLQCDMKIPEIWVMDGYATNVENVSDKSTLYHCVWGWGGKSNGYFYWNYNILASNVVGLDINDNYNGYQAAKHELMDLHFMSNFKKVLK